ncbi:hypothetical protein XELAEV_18040711mg [Xenopus laevis]|uniref:Ig-like domain-containing protein n=1 Tax=Xenopus laevis TaxID=8355 RepID=A0A974CB28_XENLA|nr:hypothetical protein XELAEV_18040711mg [Xenopus laevis]
MIPIHFFPPNWNPIFTGGYVTLTCNVASTAQGNMGCSCYWDEQGLHCVQKAGIVPYSGDWQCPVSLEIYEDGLILQTPLVVHEGDSLSLRCHSRPEYLTRDPVFYKDNQVIQSPLSQSEIQLSRVDSAASGTYRCEKKIFYDNYYYHYVFAISEDQYISVLELFSTPQIKVRPDQVTEGDHMTITCDTKLSPHRETTELQFVFYRNGHNVQGFSLSNQYGVPSAQLEDSGKYTCEVQTPSRSVFKRSTTANIQIGGKTNHF